MRRISLQKRYTPEHVKSKGLWNSKDPAIAKSPAAKVAKTVLGKAMREGRLKARLNKSGLWDESANVSKLTVTRIEH